MARCLIDLKAKARHDGHLSKPMDSEGTNLPSTITLSVLSSSTNSAVAPKHAFQNMQIAMQETNFIQTMHLGITQGQ